VKALGQVPNVVGKQWNAQILVYLLVTYVPADIISEAGALGL